MITFPGSHAIYYDPKMWNIFEHVYNFAGRTVTILFSESFEQMPKCRVSNQSPVQDSLFDPFIGKLHFFTLESWTVIFFLRGAIGQVSSQRQY